MQMKHANTLREIMRSTNGENLSILLLYFVVYLLGLDPLLNDYSFVAQLIHCDY